MQKWKEIQFKTGSDGGEYSKCGIDASDQDDHNDISCIKGGRAFIYILNKNIFSIMPINSII